HTSSVAVAKLHELHFELILHVPDSLSPRLLFPLSKHEEIGAVLRIRAARVTRAFIIQVGSARNPPCDDGEIIALIVAGRISPPARLRMTLESFVDCEREDEPRWRIISDSRCLVLAFLKPPPTNQPSHSPSQPLQTLNKSSTIGRIILLQNDTYRHLSALAIVYNVNMLIVWTSAPGVTGVAEATRLIDLTITAQGLIVVGADLTTRIDLLVAELHANALSRALLQLSRRTLQTRPAPQCLSMHGSWSKRCCFDPTSFLPFSRMTSASSAVAASSAISSASSMFMISSCTGASVVVVRRRYFRLR
ncbi:hypothetical protein ALC60_01279, partial [Trachymyrmex zeteki]